MFCNEKFCCRYRNCVLYAERIMQALNTSTDQYSACVSKDSSWLKFTSCVRQRFILCLFHYFHFHARTKSTYRPEVHLPVAGDRCANNQAGIAAGPPAPTLERDSPYCRLYSLIPSSLHNGNAQASSKLWNLKLISLWRGGLSIERAKVDAKLSTHWLYCEIAGELCSALWRKKRRFLSIKSKGWLTPIRCSTVRRVADTSEIRQDIRHGAARRVA